MDAPEPGEDVPREARHEQQVHADISTEKPEVDRDIKPGRKWTGSKYHESFGTKNVFIKSLFTPWPVKNITRIKKLEKKERDDIEFFS